MLKVDGENFVKKVKIKQEELSENVEPTTSADTGFFSASDISSTPYAKESLKLDDEKSSIDTETSSNNTASNILDDFVTDMPTEQSNKKKYILLGLILVILFIATLVITRIVYNKDQENQLITKAPQTQKIQKEKLLDKIETEEEYTKTITKPKLDIEKPVFEEPKIVEPKEIQLPEPIKEEPPIKIEKPKQKNLAPKDIFEIEKPKKKITKVVSKPKPVVQKKINKTVEKPHKKKIVIPAPRVQDLDKKVAHKLSGYYIQIAAVTKQPSKRYLASIMRKGYDYAIYPVTIKGKRYKKILIGAYPTRNLAKKVLNKVRKTFKNKHAYIIKF